MTSPASSDPDLSRLTCPRCGYSAVFATWCSDSCCDQSPERFLLGDLPRAAQDAGVPAFAVRYLTPPRDYSADLAVRIWRAGSLTPLFTGRLADAVEFTMSHDCHQGRPPSHDGRLEAGDPGKPTIVPMWDRGPPGLLPG